MNWFQMELYDTAYPPKLPIVDGLLYNGTYLFVGSPKIGKSFFMQVILKVNPSPIPIPSNNDGIGGFLEAYASARPRMIQFTTISGIYTPKDSDKEGVYACMINCTTVTRDATITM